MITGAQLKAFAPQCRQTGYFADLLTGAARRVGVQDVAHWLAQLHHETAGFTQFVENLNYSAERLMQVWPRRFPTLEDAKPFARAPELLGEKVYGGRMGNDKPGDGGKYIGRGAIMRTGKSGYAEATAAARMRGAAVDFLESPTVLGWPEYAFQDAADFWADHGLNDAANITTTAATLTINGGTNGVADRQLLRTKADAIWA